MFDGYMCVIGTLGVVLIYVTMRLVVISACRREWFYKCRMIMYVLRFEWSLYEYVGLKVVFFKRMALEVVAGHYKCVTLRVVTIKVM